MVRTAAALALSAIVLSLAVTLNAAPSQAMGMIERAARGRLSQTFVPTGHGSRRFPSLSGGLAMSAREAYVQPAARSASNPATVTTLGCTNRTSNGDVRVNQDCSFRRQTAGAIGINPTNANNIVVGQNDSSVGWNHCGYDYSLDGGKTWGGGTPPFFERGNHPAKGHTIDGGPGTMHTYDAASDPSVAFDSRGNAYLSCVLFDINDPANGVMVLKSPATAEGSFFNVPAAYSSHGKDVASSVVVEDNSINATADEPKIAADSFAASPYRDRVYATWTEFISGPSCTQGGTCSSPIFFAESSNGGQTWSTPSEISGNSRTLCADGNLFDNRRKPHDCDFDEGSFPIVLPNGYVVVLFNNANTAGSTVNNQILAVVSKNGGATWSRPVLVGPDVVKGEPQCNLGDGNGPEECIPGNFIRGNDDPSAAVDPTTGGLYAVWNDYSAGRYSVRIAISTTSGASWTESPHLVDSAVSDSYMPAVGVSAITHHLAVGYYTTTRVAGENKHTGLFKPGAGGIGTEPSEYVVSTAPIAGGPWSAASVSPSFAPPNGAQAGYDGDYSGIAITGSSAHAVWSDTRNALGTLNDEDVFTSVTPIP